MLLTPDARGNIPSGAWMVCSLRHHTQAGLDAMVSEAQAAAATIAMVLVTRRRCVEQRAIIAGSTPADAVALRARHGSLPGPVDPSLPPHSPGAKPRRMVFSQQARGSTNCSR